MQCGISFYNNPAEISYEKFVTDHLLLNKPCLFGASFISNAEWPCMASWNDPTSKWFTAIVKKHHSAQVPVDMPDREREDMTLADVAGIWDKGQNAYVKDWHLQQQNPNELFYETLLYFSDDWLNGFSLAKQPPEDFKFVYAGSNSTSTAKHHDVYGSYSWSINILGEKIWTLYPENQSEISVHQLQGQTIFIPSLMYHRVENVSEGCISINHNWINAYNLSLVLDTHLKADAEVEQSILDVLEQLGPGDEWQLTKESLLKAHAGWGWTELLEMCEWRTQHSGLSCYDIEEIKKVAKVFSQTKAYGSLKAASTYADNILSF